KANIGAALGQRDEADWLAGRIEDLDAILLLVAHSPPAPKVAIDIDAEAVRRAAGLRGDERPAVGELGAVVGNVVDFDDPRRNASIDNVHFRLVGRESQPVRA